ncbi:hypothetical protein G4G27_02635 [Sphingomonas sp. So64.6b]|uniref:hypothetical protein n=1 Tax=Sphingomonas sp. So64.6b TaxID=2997354 RepID=UPI0016024E02|nr:hypothetical protein [Sphingomonas sp. So64.6b]QNA83033.1 hypothetical protein G4G27_02635 [Sphingomonas sp. So64.6b]
MMLRTIVLVIAALAFTTALVAASIDPAVWPMALILGLTLAGILFERSRYGAIQARPADRGWRETSERFIDDDSGRPVAVWYNDATGERRYVDIEQT